MGTQLWPIELRLFAALLALLGVVSVIWPIRVNRPFARGGLERLLYADPGAIRVALLRLFFVYWTAVWGWFALFGDVPPYFP
ncbi:hypothetical protein ACOZ4N_15785 [Halorientalis pallida]|uniref:hypothetical protein n=1 Tax=Halorientalis pallida TaxID=2479928 RepID=UPI003C6FE920